MSQGRTLQGWAVAVAMAGLGMTAVEAANFADRVIDYTPGSIGAPYQDPAAALGKPNADTGFGVLTPFNGAWAGTDLVGVGPGGSLTLRLAHTIRTDGFTLGVHAGVGLIDADWPNGNAGSDATWLTNPRMADVRVSEDGIHFTDLGTFTFGIPTNFYAEGIATPGYQATPGTVEADWEKPFLGTLDSFDGQSWGQMLDKLGGSAGGTWLDLSATGLSGINYVQFSVGAEQTQSLYIDAVVGIPAVVPEPAVLGLLCLGGLILLRRRSM